MIDVPEDITEEEIEDVKRVMSSAIKYSVPVYSDAELMTRWGVKEGSEDEAMKIFEQ